MHTSQHMSTCLLPLLCHLPACQHMSICMLLIRAYLPRAQVRSSSTSTIFFTFKKVSARAQPAAAPPPIPRSQHLTRVVLFVQLSVALGRLKLRNPLEPTRESWMYSGVRVALVWLPPIPVAIRAGVGSRERVAHLLSVLVCRSGAAAPACVSCQQGRAFGPQ